MKVSRLVSAVTLGVLGMGIRGSMVSCAEETNATSVKSMMEFIDKLWSQTDVRKQVWQKLQEKVAVYSNDTYAKNFYKGTDSVDFSGFISEFFEHLHGIRGGILTNSASYGASQNTAISVDSVDSLVNMFPPLYSALYYLHFNGSKTDCSTIKGGKWETMQCNQTGSNQYFGEWLTDKIDNQSPRQLIQRGFTSDELGSTTAQAVANLVKPAVNHNTGGSLQNALYGLLFLGSWHDAKTGHALSFLHEFCVEVLADTPISSKFTPAILTETKNLCGKIKQNIDPLVDQTSSILAIALKSTQKYQYIWNGEAFSHYVSWLVDNLEPFKTSLAAMYNDSSKWTDETLKNGTSAGPYKYGFTFRNNNWGDDVFTSSLQAVVKKLAITEGTHLTGLLEELKKVKELEKSGAHLPVPEREESKEPEAGDAARKQEPETPGTPDATEKQAEPKKPETPDTTEKQEEPKKPENSGTAGAPSGMAMGSIMPSLVCLLTLGFYVSMV
ncbi:secreted antigen 1 [Babesia divergens]|uniref:Secreted antigen 1 n=1 Tax=Babesia divergens TaxID=32595 RepID=A0AAD9LJG0_BABDI|nr:secreted antigen 1 [Babesia divergens]